MAKEDKASVQILLDAVRPRLGALTQWDIIATTLVVLKWVKKDAWISSFEKVLHPHKQMKIDELLKKRFQYIKW